MHEFEAAVIRVAHRYLRQAALELEFSTPAEQAQIVSFVSSAVPTMSDSSVAYGAYAVETLAGKPATSKLHAALIGSYRQRMLHWFTHAIKARAAVGGGGTGIKRLKEGLAAFVEDLPTQLLRGYKPLSAYISGNITDVVASDKLDAASASIYKAVKAEFASTAQGKTAREHLPVVWEPNGDFWYIPSSAATFPIKDQLGRAGFRWNPGRKRWEALTLTPAMRALVEPPPAKAVALSPQEVTEWFFGAWLPSNIQRFNKVFNTYVRSKETTYAFSFQVTGQTVSVEVDRELAGPRDAVQELRYRYLGRQGRKPWLQVLDYYVELTRTTEPKRAMFLIDRMNNLQHSNGLFMEHFPKNVQTWYSRFLDHKFSARDAWTLAKFIKDTDLRDVLQFYTESYGIRSQNQGAPDLKIEQREEEGPAVNWREKGYPREKGYTQPTRDHPDVQLNLEHLPRAWDQVKP